MRQKKYKHIIFFSIFLTAGSILLSFRTIFPSSNNIVHMIQLNDDTINPVTAEYISQAIDRAAEENAQCLIIKLDTPGGLLSSTRLIVKKMLTAEVPIVVYISPSGSRAGSAGVFITYASHIAAMAPSTNIGAAHPVQLGGGSPKRNEDWDELKKLIKDLQREKEPQDTQKGFEENKDDLNPRDTKTEERNKQADKEQLEKADKNESIDTEDLEQDEDPMESKILQDTVAFIRALAKERNRNEEWAIKSVTKSLSITNDEALEKGVVEIVAKNDQDLLNQLDGRNVKVGDKEIVLQTKNAVIENVAMDFRQAFFNILANPNIAYILMILGFYGLLYEITHPGFGVPGILGTIFLILAFYSMQTLPTNYAGLALMALGLGLLIAEAYTPVFGILTLGGLVCLVLGSMLLFESTDPIMRVSMSAIVTFSVLTTGLTLFLVRAVLKTKRTKIQGGQEGLIGEVGEAHSNLKANKKGKVDVHGEIWNAISQKNIAKGEEIVVEEVHGLTLKVRKNK